MNQHWQHSFEIDDCSWLLVGFDTRELPCRKEQIKRDYFRHILQNESCSDRCYVVCKPASSFHPAVLPCAEPFNPFTAAACKIYSLKDAGTHLQTVYFPGL